MEDESFPLAERLQKLFKPSWGWRGFCVLGAAGFLAMGIWAFYEGAVWNKRLVSWKKVPGIIAEKTVDKKGNFHYEYEFLFNKRLYRGNKVVFDRTFAGYRKTGDKCTVLMAPDAPGKNALFAEPTFFGRILFYIHGSFFLFFAFVFCSVIFQYTRECRKNAQVPENLGTYVNSFSPEVLEQLRLRKRDFQRSAVRALQLREKDGVLFMCGTRNTAACYLSCLLYTGFLIAACLLKYYPLATLLGVQLFLAVILDLFCFRTGVEFEQKRFFIESTFMGMKREGRCSEFFFADIEYFLVTSGPKIRSGLGWYGAVVLKDGRAFILFSMPPGKCWQKGLVFLPDLAEKCGSKPLVFDL